MDSAKAQLRAICERSPNKHIYNYEVEQITVFIGVNGSGKSSIFHCLAILLSWFAARIENPKSSGRYFKDEYISWQHQEVFNEITTLRDNNQQIT